MNTINGFIVFFNDAISTGYYFFTYCYKRYKIDFSQPKKNPTSDQTPKVVQTKLLLKVKSQPVGLLSGSLLLLPVVSMGKRIAYEPPQKAKPSSSPNHSSSSGGKKIQMEVLVVAGPAL
ncbi:hypothetical protein Fot_25080 [Forsythia ovata]|uniref:Uncharacterized protein n=1 Tax=Forsythia ovata TaxID=205694 RepID=A0ABD1U823_9LAMI